MTADTRIRCDGCGYSTDYAPRRAAQHWRISLRAQGWVCRTAGGLDYCPDCVATGRQMGENR